MIVNEKTIPVQYYFTKDDVIGKQPGARNVWVVIKFTHPESKQQERIIVTEPQSILESTEKEVHAFIEREVECFFKHCDEEMKAA